MKKKIILIFLILIVCTNSNYPVIQQNFDDELHQIECVDAVKTMPEVKEWTFITYMAADNNLAPFARKNLKEHTVWHLPYMHRFVHLDTTIPGNKKITKRYVVTQNMLTVKNNNDSRRQAMDSGNPNTLIDCCKQGIENCPAKKHIVNFWDHGSGPVDVIKKPRVIDTSELFIYNPLNNLIELDRSIGFLDYLEIKYEEERGICFDDSTGHYLTNQGLEHALKAVCTDYLHTKFNIIAFDACLMATIEIANIIKNYANIMIASQEVVLGTGWRYDLVFAPFSKQTLNEYEFASHIIAMYEHVYSRITNDYTLSALDLRKIPLLEQAIDRISLLLVVCLENQVNDSVTNGIRASKDKHFCTIFDEPTYIDLHHFLTNLLMNIKKFKLKSSHKRSTIKELEKILAETQDLILDIVFANTVGRNLSKAKGLSIYFPERRIHPSYKHTNFYKLNNWSTFLNSYLSYAN